MANGPDIPGIKRAGLPVDLDRLTAEGDSWLSPEERYALKTHGICAQAHPGTFMIRCRTQGSVTTDTARALAMLADSYGRGWIHLTTRQQIELHHVAARNVTTVLEAVNAAGLTTRSTCGHTMRGVMSCPDAGVGLDEPFDCLPDARAVAASILKRTPLIDTLMPSRMNIHFGGCAECRKHARLNDAGFVSMLNEDGEPGYEMWAGGSLGKSAPTLAMRLLDFIPRAQVLAATHALFDVYIRHGDFDHPNKARMKFLVRKLGTEEFRTLFLDAFDEARALEWPAPEAVEVPELAAVGNILGRAPDGGWSSGIRPQRTPGVAMVTVNVPLGDLRGDELRALSDMADDGAGRELFFTRGQNVMLRSVALDRIPLLRQRLAAIRLSVEGADQSRDVRACVGGPVCNLALTPAQALGAKLLDHPALVRNSGLSIAISGCPNACAQHQIADIGFSGGKVTIEGVSMHGYQVWLGADVRNGIVGEVVGRVADADVPAIVDAIVGVWEALRERGEQLSHTVNRIGLEPFESHVAAIFAGLWERGPEPDPSLEPEPVPLIRGGVVR